jgi:hypothetical protein
MKEKIRNFCSRVSIGEGGPDPRERALDSMVPERGLSRVVVVGPGGWTRLLCVSHAVCQTSRHMVRISGTACFFPETVSYVQQPRHVSVVRTVHRLSCAARMIREHLSVLR